MTAVHPTEIVRRRPWIRSWVALALTLGSSAIHAESAAANCRVDSLESHVRVLEDGGLHVRERFVLENRCARFTRRLSLRRTDGIEIVRTTREPHIVQQEKRILVTWGLGSDVESRTFELEYRVRGAMQVDGNARRVRWSPAELNRNYRIGHAEVALAWPSTWPAPSVEGPRRAQFERHGDELRASRNRVGKDLTLRWEATFTGPASAFALPAWQVSANERRQRDALAAILAVAIAVVGIGIVLAMHRERGLHVRTDRRSASEGPPGHVSPAVAGAVRRGKPELVDAVACCVDLARRGHLLVEVTTGKRWYQSGSYVIRRGMPLVEPRPWERVVLSAMVANDAASLPAAAAWKRLRSRSAEFQRTVVAELRRLGVVDNEARAARQQPLHAFAFVAWLLAGATTITIVVLWQRLGPAALLVPLAFAIVGSVALGIAHATPRHTSRGQAEAALWKAFAGRLNQAAKSRSVDEGRFHGDLAYALGLDLGDAWVQAAKHSHRRVPRWFRPLPQDGVAIDDFYAWLQGSGALASTQGKGMP